MYQPKLERATKYLNEQKFSGCVSATPPTSTSPKPLKKKVAYIMPDECSYMPVERGYIQ